jgi:hypothetical protein
MRESRHRCPPPVDRTLIRGHAVQEEEDPEAGSGPVLGAVSASGLVSARAVVLASGSVLASGPVLAWASGWGLA